MKSLLLASLLLVTPAIAADWNQWRGPNRDGKIVGFKSPPTWPKSLKRGWKVEVGEGHSSPLLIGNRVYIFSRQGDEEIVRCLDLKDGREVWKDRYAAPYTMNPAATGHGKGPKATPVYRDGRLFTLGISGILSGLDAKSGKVLWRKKFAGAYKETSPAFGAAMSPIVEGGLLIAHVGGQNNGELSAFDIKTGDVRWRWTGDGPAYASPVVATRDGVRQIVTQTQTMCVGLDARSGKLLWSVPFKTPYDQNSVTPVVAGDLIVFAGLQQSTFAVRLAKAGDTWKADKVWESREAMQYMSTSVLSGGKLYGMSNRQRGQMFVLDAASGKALWTNDGRMGDNAAVLDASDVLFVLTPTADLFVYRKQGDALSEAARYSVAEGATWATPAIQDKNLLVKDVDTLALWRLPG